jgi:hypothetical protein
MNASVRRLLASLALTGLFALSSASLVSFARADDVDPDAVEGQGDAATSRSATFQAVSGAQQEDVPGGPLLVAAYGTVLALVLGYVVYLGSLTSGASRDLDRLEKALEARRVGPPGPDVRKSARADDAGEAVSKESAKDT